MSNLLTLPPGNGQQAPLPSLPSATAPAAAEATECRRGTGRRVGLQTGIVMPFIVSFSKVHSAVHSFLSVLFSAETELGLRRHAWMIATAAVIRIRDCDLGFKGAACEMKVWYLRYSTRLLARYYTRSRSRSCSCSI